ncbi:MAG: DUF1328 domain-containing protein [Bdellovibrionales bacterium]
MIYWSIVFFVLSLIAAFFGFGGLAEGLADVAKFLFYAFLVLFGITLVAALWAGNKAKNMLTRGT